MEAVSRQVRRAMLRRASKEQSAKGFAARRRDAGRAKLDRQTRREKAGFYAGRSVAASISLSRSRLTTRKVKKGEWKGRYLSEHFHSTKGWRP